MSNKVYYLIKENPGLSISEITKKLKVKHSEELKGMRNKNLTKRVSTMIHTLKRDGKIYNRGERNSFKYFVA